MIYGTIRFYSCIGDLLFERQYHKHSTRNYFIETFSEKRNVCYYQIIPNFIKRKRKTDEEISAEAKKIVRPPAVYTNLKTNYYEINR